MSPIKGEQDSMVPLPSQFQDIVWWAGRRFPLSAACDLRATGSLWGDDPHLRPEACKVLLLSDSAMLCLFQWFKEICGFPQRAFPKPVQRHAGSASACGGSVPGAGRWGQCRGQFTLRNGAKIVEETLTNGGSCSSSIAKCQ